MAHNEKPHAADVRIIEDEKTARTLVDPTLRALLGIFMRSEASTSEAAEQLGEDLDAVYYQVRKLENLGILEIARRESRAGRPIKYYRAVARDFFVPFALLPQETFPRAVDEVFIQDISERIAEGLTQAMRERFDDPRRWGFRIFSDRHGGVHVFVGLSGAAGEGWDIQEFVLEPGAPPVFATHASLDLTRGEAKTMQRELHDVVKRWATRSRDNQREGAAGPTRSILLQVRMAPAPRE